MRASLLLAGAFIFAAAACNPYENQQGEFNAGPVDPATFPLAYLGTGASATFGPNGRVAGTGRFIEIGAYAGTAGTRIGYYTFPFTATQTAMGTDPLRLLEDGRPYRPVPVANAYVFDSAPPRAFPGTQTCTPPSGYVYDRVRDDMRLDEQSNIFTQLPYATQVPGVAATFTYVPVVAELPVSAAGMRCQSLKSEKTLNKVLGNPGPRGNYLLWPIIDPTSPVYRVGQNPNAAFGSPDYAPGVGAQKYGWFARYYLAYLDGGYIQTESSLIMEGTPARSKQVVRMKTQRIYFPRTMVRSSATATPVAGALGAGYDVLQLRRADAGYTPVCEVWTYSAGATPRLISDLPRTEAAINALAGSTPMVATAPRFIYCPQIEPAVTP